MDLAKHNYYANNQTYDGFERFWSNDPVRENYANDDSWKAAKAERKRLRKLFTDRARQSLAVPGKKVLTDEQVSQQINALRKYRN